MIFKLSTGNTVHVRRIGTGTEFVTYNASGDCISTAPLAGDAARETLTNLQKAALR